MALPIFEKDIAFVSKLDDYPNDVGGLSAAELKAVFDQAGQEIQQYINDTLIPEVESEIQMAAEGERPGGNLNGDVLAVGSVTGDKLAYKTVTGEKLADGSVNAAALANSAVTNEKLAIDAVTTAKIADLAVSAEKLADNAVSERKIRNGSVTNTKIAAGAISSDKLAPNAAHSVITVTLTASGWVGSSQTVTANGMASPAQMDFIASPAPASHDAYCEAGIRCVNSDTNSVTFQCLEIPTVDIQAYITILR